MLLNQGNHSLPSLGCLFQRTFNLSIKTVCHYIHTKLDLPTNEIEADGAK